MIRWALSLIRARASRDRLLLAATSVMVLISTTLLAAGPIYSDAMSTAGLQRRISDAPSARSGIAIEVRGSANALGAVESAVDTTVDVSGFPSAVERTTITESPSLVFPERLGLDDKTRTVISYREQLEGPVTLTEGRHAAGPDEVVIHAAALPQTGIAIGDIIRLTTAGASANEVTVTIVGAVEPTTASDPTWEGDELGVSGVVESGGFITVGPLWATADGFTTMLGDIDAVIGVRLDPDPSGITPANSSQLGTAATSLDGQLDSTLPEGMRLSTATELPQLLDEATMGLQVSRTTVILTVSQLAILSIYALVLAAGLLVESRAVETALLRSRGFNQSQLTLVAIIEGLLLVLPGVLLGPLIATALLGLIDGFGSLAAAGLELAPQLSLQALAFAGIGGVLSLIAMVGPARRQAEAYMEVRSSVGRDRRAPLWQRTGLDIAFVILAVVGLWQLRRYGGTFISGASGQLRADPTLVAAPTVALIAAVVVSLRLIPLAGKLGERWARHSRTLAAPLGSRQIARRPVYHARSALLLTMAATIGFFTASFSGTWTDSQEDQARFAIPSDTVVAPFFGPGSVFPLEQLDHAYSTIPGVADVTSVITANVRSNRLDEAAQLIGVNSEALGGEGFSVRPDLLDRPLDEVRSTLGWSPPQSGIPLPDDADTIFLTVSDDSLADGTPVRIHPVEVDLVLKDGSGLLHTVPATGPTIGGEAVHIAANLTNQDQEVFLSTPLALVGFQITVPTPVRHEITIHDVTVRSGDGPPVKVTTNPSAWEVLPNPTSTRRGRPTASVGATETGWLRLNLGTEDVLSNVQETVTFRAWIPDSSLSPVLPAVATRSFLEESETALGEEMPLETEGAAEITVRFVDVAEELPTLGLQGRGILVDAPRLQMILLQGGYPLLAPTRWHLDLTDDVEIEEIESVLADAPFASRAVESSESRTQSLLNDPLALGIVGSLTIGLIAALAVAVIGLGAAAVVSTRQRVGEFSLLQALGTSRREMARALAVENGFTILGSLATGIALGLGLAWLVLPSVAISPSSVLVVPQPLVVVPWMTAGVLIVSGLALIALLSSTLSANLQQQDTASVLRLGEDV